MCKRVYQGAAGRSKGLSSVGPRAPAKGAGGRGQYHERRADIESGARGPSENRLGQGPGAGRAGTRASAPWSRPDGREPTRPLGDLRAGQQPGALRLLHRQWSRHAHQTPQR